MEYGLPTKMEIGGAVYDIRTDFRVALDIHAALNDMDLEPDVRAYEVLHIFYPEADAIPEEYQQEAVDKCLEFLQGGRMQPASGQKEPRLVDWSRTIRSSWGLLTVSWGRKCGHWSICIGGRS